MHVRVVELMVAGVRRPREECLADPGTIGTLSIGDIPIGTAEKRPLHAAQLWERWGTSARRGLLPPLFDVQVLRITPRGLLLRGFQVDTSNRPNTAQHTQEWWAVPIEMRIPTIVTAHTDERDRCSVRASVVFRV